MGKKILKATVYKVYKVKDNLQYSNSVLYYYFDIQGNYVKRLGDFGKSISQHKITENQIFEIYPTIWGIWYKVEFCSGLVLSFIDSLEEAVSRAKAWTDLNNLKL